MTTTDRERAREIDRLERELSAMEAAKNDAMTLAYDRGKEIESLQARNAALGQLLAHIHLHMTNDENFDVDELESDIRSLDSGKWVDTETILITLRATYEAERIAHQATKDAVSVARDALASHTENDAHLNIEGAITDIDHSDGRCDAVSRRTLGRVSKQLAAAQQALGAIDRQEPSDAK